MLGEGAEGRVVKGKVPEIGEEFALKIYDLPSLFKNEQSNLKKEF